MRSGGVPSLWSRDMPFSQSVDVKRFTQSCPWGRHLNPMFSLHQFHYVGTMDESVARG